VATTHGINGGVEAERSTEMGNDERCDMGSFLQCAGRGRWCAPLRLPSRRTGQGWVARASGRPSGRAWVSSVGGLGICLGALTQCVDMMQDPSVVYCRFNRLPAVGTVATQALSVAAVR
jgi:hypothetical protein